MRWLSGWRTCSLRDMSLISRTNMVKEEKHSSHKLSYDLHVYTPPHTLNKYEKNKIKLTKWRQIIWKSGWKFYHGNPVLHVLVWNKRQELERWPSGSRSLLSSLTTRVLAFKLPSDSTYTVWHACLYTCTHTFMPPWKNNLKIIKSRLNLFLFRDVARIQQKNLYKVDVAQHPVTIIITYLVLLA